MRDASPLWTLQRLCFEPDVAADFSDRGENRDLGTATEAIKIQLTREMRLENDPVEARAIWYVAPRSGAVMCPAYVARPYDRWP